MATLVLTAVGTAIGGPVGGAIGAVIGQAADQSLFGPKARHGPRLGELAVQTSTYGSQVPKLFGTIRVAGTVIWATDLIESRSSSGGGKGRPRTVNYSYSANFAVALSARKVRAIHRIWADGKLLRGAAGDLKAAGALRFHDGDEDQPADPLITSAEGGEAPAYRGTAYVVFEGLQLADFGNRIPSLTFEVEADPVPVEIGRIAEELSDGAVVAGTTPAVRGYAASGDSVRTALAALADPALLSLSTAGSGLLLRAPAGPAASLAPAELCAGAETVRQAQGSVPAEATLSYYDPARDYQIGTQRAFRGAAGRRSDARSLAVVLAAEEAKALAEARLAALWAARSIATVRLGWRREALRPGALVRLAGVSGLWKVRRWLLEGMAVELELARIPEGAAAAPGAAPGRAVSEADMIHGPTTLRLIDLPLQLVADAPALVAMAGGIEGGWRQAAIMFSSDGGATWREAGRSAERAILGQSLTPLAASGSALLDLRGSVDVELPGEAQVLASCSDAALAGGANLALLGRELIQFATAEPLGGRRFRLRRLLRGRRGTEWAMSHEAGEAFALLAPETMLPLDISGTAAGATVIAIASGIGDAAEGVKAELEISGEALRPPSPVHLRARWEPDGAIAVSWVRRSRLGWVWASGGDTPLGEETEAYLATVSGAGGRRTFELATPAFIYPAAEQQADGISFPVMISVSQVGTHAASRPATLALG